MSERERMLRGEPYNARDESLLATAHRARALIAQFAAAPSTDAEQRRAILTQLLGGVGEDVWIEPPFFCDYGENVYIGAHSFVNVNCVFLDSAEIRIGANALIGPGVQFLTAFHPLPARERVVPETSRSPDQAPYVTQALPIRVGSRVWIGGGAILMPGVTIGDNVTIGAGSVVTSDIPPDSLAFGQPCRVQRSLA
ncbi:MAG TPA: sugar O-acetyltransferase [Gemmatimonadaceae bacterium]|nr:sugar O-acetyltransferase [Gemmatimonadaceae bacterium]